MNHIDEYEGHWISTFTGKKFHYLNPTSEEIDIRDIAHALSLTCRFGGHSRVFYSVAQHSALVAQELPQELRLAGLLHDAHEAYLHDVPRPIKQDIRGYKEIADRIQYEIDCKYGTAFPISKAMAQSGLPAFGWGSAAVMAIKFADNTLCATEARDLGLVMTDWMKLPPPLEDKIAPWEPRDAEESFLNYFKLWGGKDGIG